MDSEKKVVTNHATAAAHKRPNYLLVFISLAILTGLEVAITFQNVLPIAPFLLAMSFVKAMLVILYFMHLKSDSRWFGAIFFLPFVLVIPMVVTLLQ